MKGLKWVTTLQITFVKQNNENQTRQAFFNSTADTILNKNDLNEIQSTNQIVSKIGNWVKQRSSWIIKSLDKHYFNVTQYSPLNAGSYIEYCHLAKLNEDKVKSHAERVSNYK